MEIRHDTDLRQIAQGNQQNKNQVLPEKARPEKATEKGFHSSSSSKVMVSGSGVR